MTNLEKQQFFAQYWGQEVGKIDVSVNTWNVGRYFDGITHLELKPLLKISDEDAYIIAKIQGYKSDYLAIELGKDICSTMFKFLGSYNYKYVDFLRSKGYALPWREYSVEQLIELKVIKLL